MSQEVRDGIRFEIRWGRKREVFRADNPIALLVGVDRALARMRVSPEYAATHRFTLWADMLLPDYYQGWRLHMQALGGDWIEQSALLDWVRRRGEEILSVARARQQIPHAA